jgi:diguanylate cyclase (GGDEF)-like protein
MKRLIPAVAILVFWASAAWAAEAPLTTLRAIKALTNEGAGKELPVAFEATVTYFRDYEGYMFVQDEDDPIYVRIPVIPALAPGDRVRLTGKTEGSFHPIVIADSVTLLHHGALPKPVPADFKELIRGQYDSRLVTLRAQVRSADMVVSPLAPVQYIRMELLTDGGHIEARMDSPDTGGLEKLLDAEIEVTGVAAGLFDDKMQQTGIVLFVSSMEDVKILEHTDASPWSLPVAPMDQILVDYDMRDLTPRVRVHGIITYYQPNSAVVLQDGSKSLWISTHTREPLRIGDQADATGFPHAQDRLMSLSDGEIKDSHVFQPVTPQLATWHQLAFWSPNTPDGLQHDLVSIDGQVVTEVREATQDEYVLASGDRLFTAIYHHTLVPSALAPMMEIPVGSMVRVTGICAVVESSTINPDTEVPFNILMRSPDDITVTAKPSLLNTRNLLLALGALLIVVFVVIARGWALERKVRRQTTVMSARTEAEAELERQRSRILEDINESRPLAEILMQITAMVSFTLGGAPCWCEIADGERLGNCPEEPNNLRIVRACIDSHVGPALGTLFAALNPDTPPVDRETVALNNGARLATLAIETRRLYSDLRRRSEYDLLTDIPNRFAIEKFIDLKIEEAHQSGRILGLIFIDLDEFKLVNDTYGHHVGDLYLQEAALRMSRQLLGRDMLARLGGDEFAALVSLHNGVGDLAKIVARLNHCFDRPFAVGGYKLHGAASIGVALYPQEGATKDSLLSAADAAMYAVKNNKHKIARGPAESPHTESSSEDRA